MASTVAEIYNLALNAIGARSTISDIGESSREAETCTLWYGEVRKQLLHAAPWTFATGAARLTLAKERNIAADWVEADPEPGWLYAYTLPADILRPRYLTTFDRFRMSTDTSGTQVLVTNDEETVLIYTVDHETVSGWDSNFTMAMAYGLASHIALPLQGKPDRARHLIEMANVKVLQARSSLANENEFQHESVPEWLRARGYSLSIPGSRYFYPAGPMLTGTVAPTK